MTNTQTIKVPREWVETLIARLESLREKLPLSFHSETPSYISAMWNLIGYIESAKSLLK